MILFNNKTGEEILSGIHGNPDPFILESPSMIDIGIMGHCYNNCDICYQGNTNIPNMTLDNFKLIIDQTKLHINQVALGGKGDPNKHENFEDILKYCVENNVVPNYTTSGNGLTLEEFTENLFSMHPYRVNDFFISLDLESLVRDNSILIGSSPDSMDENQTLKDFKDDIIFQLKNVGIEVDKLRFISEVWFDG